MKAGFHLPNHTKKSENTAKPPQKNEIPLFQGAEWGTTQKQKNKTKPKKKTKQKKNKKKKKPNKQTKQNTFHLFEERNFHSFSIKEYTIKLFLYGKVKPNILLSSKFKKMCLWKITYQGKITYQHLLCIAS